MTRHPTGRRVPKQETAPDDVFIARILEISAWAQRHIRLVVTVGVLLVLVIAGGLYYRNYQQALRTQAEMELMEVRMTVASGNHALAQRDLQQFLTRFGGTDAGDQARVLLAQVHLEEGQAEEAAAAVSALARNPSSPLGASAAFLLAAAREAQGDLEGAESVYLRIADRAELGFQKREALDQAARVRLERNDTRGAVQLYERLVAATPESQSERALYEMRLAEARAKALSPGS